VKGWYYDEQHIQHIIHAKAGWFSHMAVLRVSLCSVMCSLAFDTVVPGAFPTPEVQHT
jgi:hypothetical protein